MAVTTNDLTQPQGELEPSVFSEIDDFNAYLTGWLDAAPAGLSDGATRATVYARAYQWKAENLASRPAQEGVDGASSISHTDQQRAHWQQKADYWEAQSRTLDSDETNDPQPVRSQTVSTTTSWV